MLGYKTLVMTLLTELRKNPPIGLAVYAVCFAALHLIANVSGWYYLWPSLDIPMHIGGGIWVAWAVYAYGKHVPGWYHVPYWARSVAILGAVALVGVLWEFAEAGADTATFIRGGSTLVEIPELLQTMRADALWDVLYDLVNDLLGGLLVVVLGKILTKNK